MGMQYGTVALENTMKIPQEIKNDPAIPLLGIYPKGVKSES